LEFTEIYKKDLDFRYKKPSKYAFKSLFEVFKIETKIENGCYVWYGETINSGYGRVYIPTIKKRLLTHRVSYAFHNGYCPGDMLVCHRCDNPPCINHDHLFLGTVKDNLDDYHQKQNLKIKKELEKFELIKNVYGNDSLISKVVYDFYHNKITLNELAKKYHTTVLEISKMIRMEYNNIISDPKPWTVRDLNKLYDKVKE